MFSNLKSISQTWQCWPKVCQTFTLVQAWYPEHRDSYNLIILYTTKNIKFFRRSFFLIYSPCHYTRAWIRVLDAPGCYERAARAERKSALYYTTRLRIGQNCRAVCTKKSGLNRLWAIDANWRHTCNVH